MNEQQVNQMNAAVTAQLHNASDALCDECGNNTFVPVFMIKKLSALVSPTGDELNIPIQLFQCSECKHVNDEYLPNIDNNKEETAT
jgi:hypothetical protein